MLAGEFGPVQGPEQARWGYTCREVPDWDEDGDLDLRVGCVTGEILYYENIGARNRPQLAVARKLTLEPGFASYPSQVYSSRNGGADRWSWTGTKTVCRML